jgi:7-cyano-7-deazaguanine synthase
MAKKSAVVVHSGGMDSSLCLAVAVKEFGPSNVLSLSFNYLQRHSVELKQAKKIADHFKVDHIVLDLPILEKITDNALTNHSLSIETLKNSPPNTMVVGRNGLMAEIAGIHAHGLNANCLYMGVMELEGANSGYRDCSREYMDTVQALLRMDLNQPKFEIKTPLIKMTKAETMELGYSLGVLEFLLEETLTCYEGVAKQGCMKCPACKLRHDGIRAFLLKRPEFNFSYKALLMSSHNS